MKGCVIFLAYAIVIGVVGIAIMWRANTAKLMREMRVAAARSQTAPPPPTVHIHPGTGSAVQTPIAAPEPEHEAVQPVETPTTSTESKPAFREKTEGEMSPEELAVKRRLDKQAKEALPTHRVTFDKIQSMTGWILDEKPDSVTFSESFGSSGAMSVKLKRQRINSIEKLTNSAPAITYRDVRIAIDFPQMKLYKRRPYTIMTDESFFKVELIVKALQSMHAEFVTSFGVLIVPGSERREDIQVLSFSQEADFRKEVPTVGLAGLYNVNKDRLIVYNMASSGWVQGSIQHVGAEEARYRDMAARSPAAAEKLKAWKKGTENEIAWQAREQTLLVIRHEGAHQLLCNLGVLPSDAPAGMWLFEGLATYCETEHIGARNANRITGMKQALRDGHISLESVIESKSQSALAYSQYWAAIHFLIQSRFRGSFFSYIRFIRDPANAVEARAARHMELLSRHLGVPERELEIKWQKYLAGL